MQTTEHATQQAAIEQGDYRGPEGPPVVRLSQADIDELVERIADANTKAISSALQQSINEETASKFWMSGIRALQEHAAEHTGRWLLGGVWAVVQKLMLFMLLGGVVYAIGGWSALAKVWHVIFGGPNP